MTGAQLKSQEELHRYPQEVATRRPDDDRWIQTLRRAKQTVWLILLACMFLFYYLIDKLSEALSLL